MTTDFQIPREEHPFAQYIRILGKGKTGSRSFSRAEAHTAFGMLLRGEADAMQVGAFLMLLRVKEETGEELAGFVDACRTEMTAPPAGLSADLDWPSYAGKRAQHPWYLLAATLIAQAGYRVFLHGGDGHTQGRLYTEQAMQSLGLPVADSWKQVSSQLDRDSISYLPIRRFCAPLSQLMLLRPLLGLRSPVNTLSRMFNPLQASASIHSIFHPAYAELHHAADKLLGQPRSLVFKGDSGEVEIKPQAKTRLMLLQGQQESELLLPRTVADKVAAVDQPSVAPLQALWRGAQHDPYGRDATLATTAAALLAVGFADSLAPCQAHATELWNNRDKERF
ncbi:glycosyl transferase family protein [Halioglobus maricola]|uniref:glycosyl transferase family protein n=1 Tax=Halioglobus maricola TaxID=2601894 RepID=UPI001478EDD2|nr:glycosyl transferase family protein [Halioglobus maricola]